MIESLTTASPVEIDERLSVLYGERSTLRTRIDSTVEHVRGEVARHLGRGWKGTSTWDEVTAYVETAPSFDSVHRHLAQIAEWNLALEPIVEEEDTLNAEWIRRGRWTRAFLATATGGHVHSSMSCSTCNNGRQATSFYWVTDLSDHAEAEIVEKAGERACTTCYPTAPVADLNRPTQIFTPDEERKAADKIAKEAKRAEKAAAGVTVEGYLGYGADRNGTKVFKTTRAVTNDIAGNLSSLCVWGESHPSANEWLANIAACRNALEIKGFDYDYDKALAAARKKATSPAY